MYDWFHDLLPDYFISMPIGKLNVYQKLILLLLAHLKIDHFEWVFSQCESYYQCKARSEQKVVV